MTGTPKMDTGAFREYFAPLEKWLTKYNKDKNNWVGCGRKERRFFLKQRLAGYDGVGQGEFLESENWIFSCWDTWARKIFDFFFFFFVALACH